MNYNPDDFLALIQECEAQGGSHLSEQCTPDSFRLSVPIDADNIQGPRANKKFFTTGCKRHSKFIVPDLPEAYLDEVDILDSAVAEIEEGGVIAHREVEPGDFDFDDGKNPTKNSLPTVCAVDDAMGLWPRFAALMQSGESFQEF